MKNTGLGRGVFCFPYANGCGPYNAIEHVGRIGYVVEFLVVLLWSSRWASSGSAEGFV